LLTGHKLSANVEEMMDELVFGVDGDVGDDVRP
jgi:hypothetical protein